MAQQFFMYRRFGLVGSKATVEDVPAVLPSSNGKSSAARQTSAAAKNGSTSGRSKRRAKR
jgi:hypothetical protein